MAGVFSTDCVYSEGSPGSPRLEIPTPTVGEGGAGQTPAGAPGSSGARSLPPWPPGRRFYFRDVSVPLTALRRPTPSLMGTWPLSLSLLGSRVPFSTPWASVAALPPPTCLGHRLQTYRLHPPGLARHGVASWGRTRLGSVCREPGRPPPQARAAPVRGGWRQTQGMAPPGPGRRRLEAGGWEAAAASEQTGCGTVRAEKPRMWRLVNSAHIPAGCGTRAITGCAATRPSSPRPVRPAPLVSANYLPDSPPLPHLSSPLRQAQGAEVHGRLTLLLPVVSGSLGERRQPPACRGSDHYFRPPGHLKSLPGVAVGDSGGAATGHSSPPVLAWTEGPQRPLPASRGGCWHPGSLAQTPAFLAAATSKLRGDFLSPSSRPRL